MQWEIIVKKYAHGCIIPFVIFLSLPFTAVSASSKPLVCSLSHSKEQKRLNKKAEDIRGNDEFYKKLVEWKGNPNRCRGRVSGNPIYQGYWIEFFWADGSKFESSFSQPEISVIQYTRAGGIERPDDVIATARSRAAQFGLHIDWTAPEPMKEDDRDVVEYMDPNQGLNGIARFTYDRQHRLVGVSISLAP